MAGPQVADDREGIWARRAQQLLDNDQPKPNLQVIEMTTTADALSPSSASPNAQAAASSQKVEELSRKLQVRAVSPNKNLTSWRNKNT